MCLYKKQLENPKDFSRRRLEMPWEILPTSDHPQERLGCGHKAP